MWSIRPPRARGLQWDINHINVFLRQWPLTVGPVPPIIKLFLGNLVTERCSELVFFQLEPIRLLVERIYKSQNKTNR